MNKFWIALLMILTFSLSLKAETNYSQKKMVWAHCVGWGFNHVGGFDRAWANNRDKSMPYTDRPMYDKFIQTDTGTWEGARKQIRVAQANGIDGFAVNIFKDFANIMGRYYGGAEGTDFKIALCIDNGNMPKEKLIEELTLFIERYGKHPNSCIIDGRPVIFIYNTSGQSLESWKSIFDELSKKGVPAYYLAQPMRETTLWDDKKLMEEAMKVFDGLYDFGINGFSEKDICTRLENGRQAITKIRPGGMLVAGITPGYIGLFTGFYRPFLNSGTIQNNWKAAIKSQANWVCITTWNDYVEHTHFEPSSINRDALCRINSEYASIWRNESAIPRPAQPIFSYKEELLIGQDFTIDAFVPRYTTEPATIKLRITDFSGKELHKFEDFKPNKDIADTANWRLPFSQTKDWQDGFCIQTAVVNADDKTTWRNLAPVAIRYGKLASVRTIRIPFDELASPMPELTITEKQGKKIAVVRLNTWTSAGKLEIFRNGMPVAATEYSVTKAPAHKIELEIEARPQSPADFNVARLTDTSDRISWSKPFIDRNKATAATITKQPVIVVAGDFDEDWPMWRNSLKRKADVVDYVKVPQDSIYSLSYDFNQELAEGAFLSNIWDLPATSGGRQFEWLRVVPDNTPRQVSSTLNGKELKVLEFDGVNDELALPSRAMPYGPFTIEFLLKAKKNDKKMVLFSDRNATARIEITPDLGVVFTRLRNPLVISSEKLKNNEWQHLAVVYDGNNMLIYIDGKETAKGAAKPELFSINSVPTIGSTPDFKDGFSGQLAKFHLQCGVLKPNEFVMLPKK
ncbi:MAG: endo-1,3-alpha-glucanase family glycosylhydrolase [Lentisphaerota bacterium]